MIYLPVVLVVSYLLLITNFLRPSFVEAPAVKLNFNSPSSCSIPYLMARRGQFILVLNPWSLQISKGSRYISRKAPTGSRLIAFLL